MPRQRRRAAQGQTMEETIKERPSSPSSTNQLLLLQQHLLHHPKPPPPPPPNRPQPGAARVRPIVPKMRRPIRPAGQGVKKITTIYLLEIEADIK